MLRPMPQVLHAVFFAEIYESIVLALVGEKRLEAIMVIRHGALDSGVKSNNRLSTVMRTIDSPRSRMIRGRPRFLENPQ